MKEYKSKNIRNIVLVGHGGAGKTSLVEAMLFTAGATTRMGRVEDGNTVSDFKPEEIERQISTSASLMNVEWQQNKINIIDTPGYADFIGEVLSGLSVADTAVLVLKAVEGIEVGSEKAWKLINKNELPRIIVINKCDNERADFEGVFEAINHKLTHDAVIVQIPVNQGQNFNAVIDLLKMKQIVYERNGNGKYKVEEIPDNLKEKVLNLRNQLIEKIAESDEDLMNKYFENGELSDEEILNGLKKGILNRTIVHVLPTASTSNVNVAGFMDFVVSYLPSPGDRGKVKAFQNGKEVEIEINEEGEPALFVFKTIAESAIGELSLFKVYSGTITHGLD
ncbi:MAG: GTP-binding protein, partial [Ignavibacteria bacterium]